MDFVIKRQPGYFTMIVTDCQWGPSKKEAITGIYSPIRKALIKYSGKAPTLIIAPSPYRDVIITNFIGGTDISDEIIESAIISTEKALIEFADSSLPLKDFIEKKKQEYGVEDYDIDHVKPSKSWFKHSLRQDYNTEEEENSDPLTWIKNSFFKQQATN